MAAEIKRHVYVSGKVQGVWFRAWTEQQCRQLGLSGWARNLRDGRVEIVLAGSQPAVSSMISRLRDGPPMAQVDDVAVEEWKGKVPRDFELKPTA